MASDRSWIIRDYRPQLREYCADNNLSADNLFKACCMFNNEEGRLLILGEGDPERGQLGLMDDVPLPVALEVYLENGKLRFVQTDITHKYLGVSEESKFGPMPKAAVA